MISQKETRFISEALVHFPKVLGKRMEMEIYPGLRKVWGINKVEMENGR